MTGKMDKGNGASLFVAPLLLVLVVLMMAAGTGWAAEITVDDGGDGTSGCSLSEAIISANNDDADGNGCINGSGDDIIYLETDVLLEPGHAARPPIFSYYETDTGTCVYSGTLTIEGQGHTIDGGGNDGDGYVLKVSVSLQEYGDYNCVQWDWLNGVLTVNNATITGGDHASISPSMPGNGGGIINGFFGTLTLNNVTVSGNTAGGNGGGIFNSQSGKLELNNVTVTDNTAAGDGGGIYAVLSPKGKVTLNNSIISGNTVTGTASNGNELYISSGFGDLTTAFNLFGHSGESADDAFGGYFEPGTSDFDATSDGVDTPLDSILDPTLADNGGSTLTHALVPGSPAIDLDTTCGTEDNPNPDRPWYQQEDQRDEPRPVGDGCDAGSFEFSDTLGDLDDDGDVDSDDLALLAEAFGSVVGNPMYNAKADLDSDGDVDGHDLYLFTKHFVPVIAEILPQTVNEGELLSLDITASDPDNGTLHYPTENLNLPPGASFVDNGDGTAVLSWTPTCSQSGDYPTIDIEVRDQGNLSDSEPLEISVLEDNIPPSVLTKDITVQLDASGHVSITAADIDDGSNDACGVTLSIDKSEFTSADIGENTVTLTATDSNGNSGTETATVTVESNVPNSITVDSDGNCTLHDAITAANTDAPSGGCPAGSGHDEIILETDVLLDVALPVIASTITIEGQEHIIDGNNDPDVGSVLTIGIYGNLTLNEATVTGGNSDYGGGIANLWYSGTLILNNATVSGNSVSSGNENMRDALGGGIYNKEGTLILTNSTVSGNSIPYVNGPGSRAMGGGVYNEGNLTLTNSTVNSNSVACGNNEGQRAGGGGIENWGNNTTLTLTNSTVSDNSVVCKNDSYGGGIAGGISSILDSTIIGNSAGYGGGIAHGRTILVNSTISENVATSSFGGGIYNDGGEFTLINSTVSGNAGSGVSNDRDAIAALTNSTISGNKGSGVSNDRDAIAALTNSTISGNTGSGVVNDRDAIATLTNSTISGNTGNGIYCVRGGTATLVNSIISGNMQREISTWGGGIINADSFNLFGQSGKSNAQAFKGFTPGSSDITATSDGTNPTALSDILSPLTDNGGPTKTHALVPGSPALDLDATCSTGLTEDQRGEPRPVGDGCDAGSFEGSISIEKNTFFLPAIYLLLLNN